MGQTTVSTVITDAPVVSVHETARRTPLAQAQQLVALVRQHPDLALDPRAAVVRLEEQVAAHCGTDEALFLPTGKLAQQIALRIHADRRPGRRVFLAHPTNHISRWEDGNTELLHDVRPRPVGDGAALLSTADLVPALAAPDVAAVLWELPQREIGGVLPRWADLRAQLDAAHERGAATHLDGARLWQVSGFYGRTLREVCAGFDSVYVSAYKDLEAPRGALLTGDRDFVAAARRWRHRLGGGIDEAWPLALLALQGLDRVRRRMPAYLAHTRALARAITALTSATVVPDPPHAALLHVHLPIPRATAEDRHRRLVAAGGPRLALRFRPGADPRTCSFEVTVGEAACALTPTQIADAVADLISDTRPRPTQE